MSVWSTRSSGRDREFIVLKHTLKGVNYIINGVRFRESFAVVEKNSKTYHALKSIPVLKSAQEYPLIILRELKFITRPSDVKTVYGAEVYTHYLKVLEPQIEKEKEEQITIEKEQKVIEETQHVEEHKLCSYRSKNSNELCKMDSLVHSPSGYCLRHILEEPKLLELGIEVPKFIPKKEKHATKEKVAEKLQKLKREGKF